MRHDVGKKIKGRGGSKASQLYTPLLYLLLMDLAFDKNGFDVSWRCWLHCAPLIDICVIYEHIAAPQFEPNETCSNEGPTSPSQKCVCLRVKDFFDLPNLAQRKLRIRLSRSLCIFVCLSVCLSVYLSLYISFLGGGRGRMHYYY